MNSRICIDQVKDLGGGRFVVRLHLAGAGGDATLSRTQTVLAEGHEAAVQIAKESFTRWLGQVMDIAMKSLPPGMRN